MSKNKTNKEGNKDLRNLIIGGIAGLIILFIIIGLSTSSTSNKEEVQKEEVNSSNELSQEEYLEMARKSVAQDKNYDYQVLSPKWVETLNEDGFTYVYYFSPVCNYCLETTPSVINGLNNATKKIDEDFKFIQVDVTLDSDVYYDVADLEGTPTMVKYKDGVEVERVTGSGYPSQFYTDWFNNTDDVKDFVDDGRAGRNLREFISK